MYAYKTIPHTEMLGSDQHYVDSSQPQTLDWAIRLAGSETGNRAGVTNHSSSISAHHRYTLAILAWPREQLQSP